METDSSFSSIGIFRNNAIPTNELKYRLLLSQPLIGLTDKRWAAFIRVTSGIRKVTLADYFVVCKIDIVGVRVGGEEKEPRGECGSNEARCRHSFLAWDKVVGQSSRTRKNLAGCNA
ncbi:hypothetical protein PoB_005117300 [Plakobranchus ocellatus]|uniref:Uncharacterized protein n=1 Tax=Plakobranchus ocellatus TaxID=259542 RepID=A0AAV4BYG1_9GAST|nr:hypothetical protein PoB_005117300 [Plakobranchus ocellatus]